MRKFWNWVRDDGGARVLRLEGPIDKDSFWGDEVTPKAFRDELFAEDGDVIVWINSPGGNVLAAAEIYTMIRDYPGNVTVKIDAIAASSASVVAMAGDRVLMSPVAMIMVHDPMTIAMGNAKAMEKAITTLNEVKESLINAYCAKTGLSRNKIAKMMSDETWLNAKKAVELGFADEIMFAEKREEPDDDPDDPDDDHDDDHDDDDDTPEEKKDGGIYLEARSVDAALEGMLYSTRSMGQAILNSLGAFDDDRGESEHDSECEASPSEAEPEGKAAPVEEDPAPQEEPLTEAPEAAVSPRHEDGSGITVDDTQEENPAPQEEPVTEHPEAAVSPQPEDGSGITVDDTQEDNPAPQEEPVSEAPEAAVSPQPEDGSGITAYYTQKTASVTEEAEEKSTDSVLPDGFIVINKEGRTRDGSVPYIILKNQLDRMR